VIDVLATNVRILNRLVAALERPAGGRNDGAKVIQPERCICSRLYGEADGLRFVLMGERHGLLLRQDRPCRRHIQIDHAFGSAGRVVDNRHPHFAFSLR
jgi:hypothetical protein